MPVAAKQPSEQKQEQKIDGLSLIRSVMGQKIAAAKKAAAEQASQPAKDRVTNKKTVSFAKEISTTTIDTIDKQLRKKYGPKPNSTIETIGSKTKTEVKPLGSHTGELWL